MPAHSAQTAKVTLVVVVAPFELAEHLGADFKKIGAKGYTSMRVNGAGAHGPRTYGVLDGANVRFELLVSHELATKLFTHISTTFVGQAVTAYKMEVEAIPFDHFS